MEFKNSSKKSSKGATVIPIVVCCALQAGLSPQITLGDGTVNFMLILAIISAFKETPTRAVVTGFLSGLFFDLTSATPVGLMALLMTVLSYLLNRSFGTLGGMEKRTQMSVGAVASVALNAVFGLLLYAMGVETDLVIAIFGDGLWTGVLTALVMIPFVLLGGAATPTYGFGGLGSGVRYKSKHAKHLK